MLAFLVQGFQKSSPGLHLPPCRCCLRSFRGQGVQVCCTNVCPFEVAYPLFGSEQSAPFSSFLPRPQNGDLGFAFPLAVASSPSAKGLFLTAGLHEQWFVGQPWEHIRERRFHLPGGVVITVTIQGGEHSEISWRHRKQQNSLVWGDFLSGIAERGAQISGRRNA